MKRCSYCGQENPDAARVCSGCGKSLGKEPEPAIDSQLVDPALSPVIVASFNNVAEASVLKGRLAAAGIEASIPEEYEQVFSAVIPLSTVTVRVPAKDYEAAMEVLAEPADQPSTSTAPELGQKTCSACGSVVEASATVCPKCNCALAEV